MQGARRLHCAPIQAVERRERIAVARGAQGTHRGSTHRPQMEDATAGLRRDGRGGRRPRWIVRRHWGRSKETVATVAFTSF